MSADHVTVACVLRSGPIYRPIHVRKLAASVRRFLPGARFVCLSDLEVKGVDVIPLSMPWRGWWAKLGLFQPGLFDGPVVYVDLDTLLVGDMSGVASYRGPMAMISTFQHPEVAQSGVMAWLPGPVADAIWKAFTADPRRHMRRFRGDGEWLHHHFGGDVDRLQDLFPGRIVSYKRQAKTGRPAGAAIVCAHGTPKPWDPAAGWMFREWSAIDVAALAGAEA